MKNFKRVNIVFKKHETQLSLSRLYKFYNKSLIFSVLLVKLVLVMRQDQVKAPKTFDITSNNLSTCRNPL